MYIISKRFSFDSSHQLFNLPPGHKCGRLHGHTYTAEVGIQARSLTLEGWIVDFNNFKPFKDFIDETLDHRALHEVLPFQTTSENLAKYLFDKFQEIIELPPTASMKYMRVSETASTYAEYCW